MRLSGFAARWVDEECNAHAEHVENEHGRSEQAHADRVRRRADDRGDQEDSQDGVADVLEQELGVDNAEQREEEDENGQLERNAEAKDDREEESGIVLDREDRVEGFAEVQDKNLDSAG